MTSTPLRDRPWWQLAGLAIAALGALAALTWLAATYIPLGVDWYLYFQPSTMQWLSGDTQLFDGKAAGFYHLPWGIWFLVPYVLIPAPYGLALLRVTSILMLALCAWVFTNPGKQRMWGITLAVINLHAWDLIYRGQIAAVEALGAALGWMAIRKRNPWLLGGSYVFLTFSPPNTLPFILVMLWYTWKEWKRRDFWYSLLIPGGVGIASLFVFSFWPVRWFNTFFNGSELGDDGAPFLTTIWRAREMLNISPIFPWLIVVITLGITFWAWRRVNATRADRTDHEQLFAYIALSTTAIFIVTPYAYSYRYALLYAMVVPWLVGWRLEVALGLLLLTLLPLARMYIGFENSWIDIAYPIAIFAATVLHLTVFPERMVAKASQPASSG
jgi:hypothetical protein